MKLFSLPLREEKKKKMKSWSLGKQKNDADRERIEIPRRVLAAEKYRRSFCACTLTCISLSLSLFVSRERAPRSGLQWRQLFENFHHITKI